MSLTARGSHESRMRADMKNTILRISTIVILYALVPASLSSQEQIPTQFIVASPDECREIREYILEQVKAQRCPSVTVGVAKKGKILWLEAFGWADKEAGIPARPNTIYALGSMSKSITATATLALISQGRLNLETRFDEVVGDDKLLQGLGGSVHDVMIRHLLDATAGIPHGWISYQIGSEPSENLYPPYGGFVCFPPGEVFEYSNNSFGVLEAVIASTTKESFGQSLHNLVFDPLGMTGSFSQFDSGRAEEFATPYDRSGAPLSRSHGTPEGGLGLYSTASDLLRYGMFHVGSLSPGQRSPMSAEWLHRMHESGGGPSQGFFHLGWWTVGSGISVSNGSIGGANANLTIIPDEELVVVALTNQTSSLADELSSRIATLLSPAFAENSGKSRSVYASRFRTPYRARGGWLGTWEGTVSTPKGELPLTISLMPDSVTVSINSDSPVSLSNLTLNEFDELRGSFSGRIPGISPEGTAQHQIRLIVRRANRMLSGYMSSIFNTQTGGFSIPAYVHLGPLQRK